MIEITENRIVGLFHLI